MGDKDGGDHGGGGEGVVGSDGEVVVKGAEGNVWDSGLTPFFSPLQTPTCY